MESFDNYLVGKFTFELRDGCVLIFREDGTELTSQEYFNLREPLQRAYMDKKVREAESAVDSLCVAGTWVFPVTKKELEGSGRCVYFLTATDMPGQIKIGLSADLKKRANSLKFTFNNPQVLAFVKTPHPEQLELGLHVRFDGVRQKNEWFEAAPILEFLGAMRGEVK